MQIHLFCCVWRIWLGFVWFSVGFGGGFVVCRGFFWSFLFCWLVGWFVFHLVWFWVFYWSGTLQEKLVFGAEYIPREQQEKTEMPELENAVKITMSYSVLPVPNS